MKSVVHALDSWLWRRGIQHPVIRVLLRNELLAGALALLVGGMLFVVTPWIFWFGVGLALMTQVFWGLAHFFLRGRLTTYTTALLLAALLKATLRLLVTAGVLFVALVVCAAPPLAVIAGIAGSMALAVFSYALGASEHN